MEGTRLTLYELNTLIRDLLNEAFPVSLWVVAEISEIRQNRTGHCYLELVEKEKGGNTLLARSRATIWSGTYRMLKPYFEMMTGETLHEGLSILVNVTVSFHELYGMSLNILDIDPTYTMGDLAKKRLEVIARLKEEGVYEMNKELMIPEVPQRIAVISSDTAAGYGDFMAHLMNHPQKFAFHVKLYTAPMQGVQAEEGIIAALDRIWESGDDFDVVVMIRGGGSRADLSCFDNYRLAYHITQYPLPVITGIGHERDESVADLVANQSLKTPTAVASFLTDRLGLFEEKLESMANQFLHAVNQLIHSEMNRIGQIETRLVPVVNLLVSRQTHLLGNYSVRAGKVIQNAIKTRQTELQNLQTRTNYLVRRSMHDKSRDIDMMQNAMYSGIRLCFRNLSNQLNLLQTRTKYLDPFNTLRRGYSITKAGGKIIKQAADLAIGQEMTTLFSDGEAISKIRTIGLNKPQAANSNTIQDPDHPLTR
jgi:exodeoxyribonuclease VII large subunit